jgi:hypothetical protein
MESIKNNLKPQIINNSHYLKNIKKFMTNINNSYKSN